MRLSVLGSSSSGNCYLLTSREGETLVLECGLRYGSVQRWMNFETDGIVGCVVSHRHGDHAAHIGRFVGRGFEVYALRDVFESSGITEGALRAFCRVVDFKKGYRIGGFGVYVIPMVHDCPCAGFVIEHREMGRLLFATDTMMVEQRIPNLRHVMIECNYADDIMERNVDEGIEFPSTRDRTLKTHMGLETVKGFLREQDLGGCEEVVLMHLSKRNGDAVRFERECAEVCGKRVYVAREGLEIDLG